MPEELIVQAQEQTNTAPEAETPAAAPAFSDVLEPLPESAPPGQSISMIELAEILDQHREWAESGGRSGRRADLCGVNLENADLTGTNLQGAFLHKVNLRGADLSMANLQGASLVQSDLGEANLLGAELRGANLMGASLLGASGLWIGRMGRTNLFGAVLPDDAFDMDGTKAVAQATKNARIFHLSVLACAILFTVLLVFTTDRRLLLNSSAFPGGILGGLLPMSGFFLGGPLVLFGLYLRFHFSLLRLWGNVAALPAVFPNGQTLEQTGSWFLMRLARGNFQSAKETKFPLFRVERVTSAILAYWVVPAILVLFWARYLTRQDLRGTLLHVFLVTASVTAAICLPVIVARVLRPGEFQLQPSKILIRIVTSALTFSLILGCVMSLISVGVIRGVPHNSRRPPDLSPADIRRWAAHALWLVGYTPYADLNEAALSPKTPGPVAPATDDSAADAPGAPLNQASLRYAQAYRATLTNAHLWKADLEGAFFSEADLRGANLREARLHWATFDRARAGKAVLVNADGRGADFAVADLREADLSYAMLEDAVFSRANFAGATLYGANLRRAKLQRAIMEKADVRDVLLEDAGLELAVLNEGDFSFAKFAGAKLNDAELRGAILLEADLRRTVLHGAIFQGAVVREANFEGANFDGADLRGALGLTAAQICSGENWRTARFDEALAPEVLARCGGPR